MAEKEEKDIDVNEVIKRQQMQILERLGSGGLNQNDLMALWGMMNKQGEQPNTFGEMMPMIFAMKMLNPAPKQDPLLTMMLLQGMKKDNGGEVDKRIEKIEQMIKEKEDKKMYEAVMNEIKDLQKNREQVGFKDVLALISNKDRIIEDIKQIASNKDRDLLIANFNSSVKSLQDEIRGLHGGTGKISEIVETAKQIKTLYSDLGLEKVGQKSKEEVITELVRHVSDSLAPAINTYMQRVAQQPQQASSLTPEQMQRLQEIRAGRPNSVQPSNPNSETPEAETEPETKAEESYKDDSGDTVYPELIQISEGRAGRAKRRG